MSAVPGQRCKCVTINQPIGVAAALVLQNFPVALALENRPLIVFDANLDQATRSAHGSQVATRRPSLHFVQ
ncbi:hypothetical protein E4U21_006165 [Claviceps maximensis]|nr:hypothetical protein E4U21_006165 [Claviceps maximensis]